MFEARFQSFEDRTEPAAGAARIAALRAELSRRGLDGWIVPHADRHLGEYLAPGDERLAWLTGFTGSAGVAVVLMDSAVIFTDGRYQIQMREQVDTTVFATEHIIERPLDAWLKSNLRDGLRLGYDPWLHSQDGAEKLAKACASAGAMLIATEPNPIDTIWTDRPPPPLAPVVVHDVRFAGVPAASKLQQVQEEIVRLRADVLVVSDPAAIAWTFNIRGHDVPHTPIAHAFATVPKSGRPTLYIDGRKLSDPVRRYLEELTDICEPQAFTPTLAALSATPATVRLDDASAVDALARIVSAAGGRVSRGSDPISDLKGVKNPVEIAGAEAAQRRDGAAVTRFLAFLDREAPRGQLTEIDAVAALESFRRETGVLKDISFPTIAGSGPDGAIVHYRVTRRSNRLITPGDLLLIDSGAQYEDGTTDITRTIAVGTPTEEMRERFTRVLQGHIAIACAVFPEGTTGAQLDTLARLRLWAAGLDFDHGTGHGVGSYLSVHEGPARISKLGTAVLKRGMLLSNEPGYYKAEAYGIRVENLVLVVEGPLPADAERPLNAFKTLTLAPIDRRLIERRHLSETEITWVDTYHAEVARELGPLLDSQTRSWLEDATRPLAD